MLFTAHLLLSMVKKEARNGYLSLSKCIRFSLTLLLGFSFYNLIGIFFFSGLLLIASRLSLTCPLNLGAENLKSALGD